MNENFSSISITFLDLDLLFHRFVQLPELFGSKSSVRSPLKEVELEEAVSSLLPEFHPKKSELQSALSRLDDFADLHENLRQKIIELEEVFSRFPHLEAAGKVVQQNKLDLQETHSGIVRLEILKARLNHKPVPGSVS